MKNEHEKKAKKQRHNFEEYLASQDKKTQQRLKRAIWKGQKWREHKGHSANTGDDFYNATDKISTGFTELDKHTGGWPLGITTEIGVQHTGIGELRLLMPALRQLQRRINGPRQILLISPPLIPFAPALEKAGLKLSLLTVVTPENVNEALWASEEALKSNSCAATLCWTHSYKLSNRQIRRLQLAAEQHSSWHVLLRNQHCLDEPSVSGLRIKINADKQSKLQVNITKQRGKWGGQQCTLSLEPHYERWQNLPVELWPLPQWQATAQPAQLQLVHSNDIKNVSVLSGKILVAHA